jgi:hypothetical protein
MAKNSNISQLIVLVKYFIAFLKFLIFKYKKRNRFGFLVNSTFRFSFQDSSEIPLFRHNLKKAYYNDF